MKLSIKKPNIGFVLSTLIAFMALYVIGGALFFGIISDPDWKLWKLSPNPSILEQSFAMGLSIMAPPSLLLFAGLNTLNSLVALVFGFFYVLLPPGDDGQLNLKKKILAIILMMTLLSLVIEMWRVLYLRFILDTHLPWMVMLSDTSLILVSCSVLFVLGLITLICSIERKRLIASESSIHPPY